MIRILAPMCLNIEHTEGVLNGVCASPEVVL